MIGLWGKPLITENIYSCLAASKLGEEKYWKAKVSKRELVAFKNKEHMRGKDKP